MIEKKDWENLLKSTNEQMKMTLIAIEQFKSQIEMAEKKISECKDEDPAPEEIKEIAEAAK